MNFSKIFSAGKSRNATARVARPVSYIVPLQLKREALLVYSSCDSGYFKYAQALVRSIDLFSPGLSFLLHIVNPTDEVRSAAIALAASLKNTRLAVSVESIDLADWSPDERRTYYACARFPGISRLLKECGTTAILCLDADSLVVNPIDSDFTDKTDADIVVDLRNTESQNQEHVAIAAGAIWLRPTPQVRKFALDLAEEIDGLVQNRELNWFADQVVFYRQMQAHAKSVRFYNLKRKYLDWNFAEDSIVWSAKGKRKENDLRFLVLYLLLSGDGSQVRAAGQMLAAMGESGATQAMSGWWTRRIEQARQSHARVALFVPRLDLPWKRTQAQAVPPALTEDVLGLRLRWREFATRIANALEMQGVSVDMVEIPAADIEPARVDASGASIALIPHRCHLDWGPGSTRVFFYMQEYFRWVFVVDERGWSAASSAYPMDINTLPEKASNAFEIYRDKLLKGAWSSKFDQAPQKTTTELIAVGALPAATDRGTGDPSQHLPFIFLPLQIPHDQSIRYFSPIEEIDMVKALVAWAKSRNVAVVMKPHPANKKAMRQFEELVDHRHIFWSEANINDLIHHATAVYAINSGVGFEALLHLKPVVTFGRAEYDCVTFHANPGNLDAAWSYCHTHDPLSLENKYRRFVNWFLDDYAIDMSRPEHAAARLAEIAGGIKALIDESRLGQP
jgi:hypothetical protein